MQDDEPLGPGTENYIASIVAEGTARPEEARLLLVEFVRQVESGKVSPRMIEHLRDCFAAYLDGKKRILPSRAAGRDTAVSVPVKTLDKAFGLTRISSGQPKVDGDTHSIVAAQVLQRMLAGESVDNAVGNVATDRKERGEQISSDSQVTDSWARFKVDGLNCLRVARAVERLPDGGYWTKRELALLCEIYADVPGVILPGEKPRQGRHAIPGASNPESAG
jgi:hypothetical protein